MLRWPHNIAETKELLMDGLPVIQWPLLPFLAFLPQVVEDKVENRILLESHAVTVDQVLFPVNQE